MVQTQRTETMRSLQEVTRLKGQSDEADLAWTLVADSMVFQAEAEIRWLDHCESRLVRAAARLSDVSGTPAHVAPDPSIGVTR